MRPWLAALLALPVYLAVVIWLTWPLAAHPGTHRPDVHVICRFDVVYTEWVLAWETHALTTAPLQLADANIYHPARHTLFYGPTALGMLPYFAPTYLATGNPTLALNLGFLACLALTAWSLHVVIGRWTGSVGAALVAGWCVLTNRYVVWSMPLAPHFAAVQYLAPIVLLAAAPGRGRAAHVLLTSLVVLQCLTDPIYVAPGVVGTLGLLALARCARPVTRSDGMRLLGGLAVAVALLAPVYLGYVQVQAWEPDLRAQTMWGGWTPKVPGLRWDLVRATAAVPPVVVCLLVVGTICLALRMRKGPAEFPPRAWLHAALWSVTGICLSLMPTWGVLRTSRMGVSTTIGMALLAGLAFAECRDRLPARGRRGLTSALAAMVIVTMYLGYRDGSPWEAADPLPAAFPVAQVSPPPSARLVHALAAYPGPVLELPIGPFEFSSQFQTRAMYRSTFHWHPLVNGYSSYWPAGFAERMELVRRLPDSGAVDVLRRRTHLVAIILRWSGMMAIEQARWLALVAAQDNDRLQLVYSDADDKVFALRGHSGGPAGP